MVLQKYKIYENKKITVLNYLFNLSCFIWFLKPFKFMHLLHLQYLVVVITPYLYLKLHTLTGDRLIKSVTNNNI